VFAKPLANGDVAVALIERRSRMRMLIMFLPLLVLAQPPDQPLAPWGSNHDPTVAPKRHVEEIVAGFQGRDFRLTDVHGQNEFTKKLIG